MNGVWKWIPDTKFLAGGAAGVIAWGVAQVFPDMAPDTALEIGAAAAALIYYLVPLSVRDVLKRLDDETAALFKQKKGIEP